MPLQKQPININFAQGLDTKTDPWQVQLGKFLDLQNTIFDINGQLKKRNGYTQLASNTDTTSVQSKYITTYKNHLVEIGNQITCFDESNNEWNSKGFFESCGVDTQSIVRNSLNQSTVDTAIAANGVACSVYLENDGTTTTAKYIVYDSVTGNAIITARIIPDANLYSSIAPRVFCINDLFVLVYTVHTTSYNLNYLTISSVNPTNVSTSQLIVSGYAYTSTLAFDGVVANNTLYLTYAKTGNVYTAYLTAAMLNQLFGPTSPHIFGTQPATMFAMAEDPATHYIWVAWYDAVSNNGSFVIINENNVVISPAQSFTSGTPIANITMAVPSINSGIIYYEVINGDTTSPYKGNRYINYKVITPSSVSTAHTLVRSVGLASKAFLFNSAPYVLTTHDTFNQPGYFLVSHKNYTDLTTGNIIAKLAYQNGGGYCLTGLPNVTVNGTLAYIPYRFKDLIASVNKNTVIPSGSQSVAVYSQTGINLCEFDFATQVDSIEIANNLMIGSGFLWAYDGSVLAEHNFFLYPEGITLAPSNTALGALTAQTYYYQVTYEWTDNQGNIFRSAPSVPVSLAIVAPDDTITLTIPTLRLTYKSNVKICVYRSSTAQSTYYQVTSITTPTLNSTTTDSVTFADTTIDSGILGNSIIYTTGGVLENFNAPSTNEMTVFDSRLWMVDKEDPNVLWYSNQVLNATPVEMSDLLTVYVQPNIGSNKTTGDVSALGTMDDKLLIFKKDAIYYMNGVGPDATGANSQYSQPTFLTATVGCDNQRSIVFVPRGTIFQSDKGIWILERNLNTQYIGAPVERYNNNRVVSAFAVPGTNQVRFGLDNGVILMYDYYYNQWGTFIGNAHDSATIHMDKYTYINSSNEIFEETPGKYQDGNKPVLISFTTSWVNLAGIQGFQRIYDIYLIGQYLTPNKLNVLISYDYAPFASQFTTIDPQNYAGVFGTMTYGQQSPYGGPGNLEQWRIFTQQQLSQSIRIQVSEQYNSNYALQEGAGLTLSGLTMRVGLKKGTFPNPPSQNI